MYIKHKNKKKVVIKNNILNYFVYITYKQKFDNFFLGLFFLKWLIMHNLLAMYYKNIPISHILHFIHNYTLQISSVHISFILNLHNK